MTDIARYDASRLGAHKQQQKASRTHIPRCDNILFSFVYGWQDKAKAAWPLHH